MIMHTYIIIDKISIKLISIVFKMFHNKLHFSTSMNKWSIDSHFHSDPNFIN